MMNILRRITLCLFLGLSAWSHAEVIRNTAGKPVRYAGNLNTRQVNIRTVPPRRGEFRGVWIAVVENIDFPQCRSVNEFKSRYRQLMQQISRAGFTAVFFQIRSNCDAFYPSQLAPWSRWLTGVEGRALAGFDPLKFMIDEAHRCRLEFHAWFNPYRVTNSTKLSKQAYLRTLAPNNFARRNPQWVISQKCAGGNRLFLDPGEVQVVAHVAAVVREVLRRYPVDAIHFDDYFYPYDRLGNEDDRSFARYNPRRLNRANWRRSNTDALVWSVRQEINNCNRATGRKVRFGISPFGIWANRKNHRAGSLTNGKESYFTLYADTRKWVKTRMVDYIIPQIYWHFDHDAAAYAALVDWWCAAVRGTGVKLYIGMGAYRANAPGWGNYELINQLRYNRMQTDVAGCALFSCRSLFQNPKPGAQLLLNYLRSK